MPKIFHPFCCCIKSDAYNKKNSNVDEVDGRLSVQSPICNSSKNSLVQDLRQNEWKTRGSNSSRNQRPVPSVKTIPILPNKFKQASENGLVLSTANFLLPQNFESHKKCLIVDLDETLVHSSFKPVKNADFVIPVEIDNVVHQVYVLKRPSADEFLERIGALFECVLFTASLAKYADPVADLLDKRRIFRTRLFRESCVYYEGNYVKDLNRLGRDLRKVIIIDNSPASYAFHPENAVSVKTWFDDPHDNELLEILPILEELARSDDIYSILRNALNFNSRFSLSGTSLLSTTEIDSNNNNITVPLLLSASDPSQRAIYGGGPPSFEPAPPSSSPITQCLPPPQPPPKISLSSPKQPSTSFSGAHQSSSSVNSVHQNFVSSTSASLTGLMLSSFDNNAKFIRNQTNSNNNDGGGGSSNNNNSAKTKPAIQCSTSSVQPTWISNNSIKTEGSNKRNEDPLTSSNQSLKKGETPPNHSFSSNPIHSSIRMSSVVASTDNSEVTA